MRWRAARSTRARGLFLTLWYGVYDRETRRLRYASGGHPPAILRTGPDVAHARTIELSMKDPIVGVLPGITYGSAEVQLEAYAELFVFSDGAFELEGPDGQQIPWEAFKDFFSRSPESGVGNAAALLTSFRDVSGRDDFEDDVSIVHLEFS